MRRAVIVGAAGQDGRLLTERLTAEGATVLGISRRGVAGDPSFPRAAIDLQSREDVAAVVAEWRPEEVYYLAAYHHSSQDSTGPDPIELFAKSEAVHVHGLLHFLEAIRTTSPATRLFYAASSLVFGDSASEQQNEQTALNPRCIYGITKSSGVHCCRHYRETQGVFASVGFLYNHESSYRQEKFVSQKIIRGARAIAAGEQEKLILGDLSAAIDWGYAPDFVEAMEKVLAFPEAGDFIFATGETHTVREFVEVAFGALGLDWRAHVEERPGLLHRKRPVLRGDASRLRTATGWRPSLTFAEMVERLLALPAEPTSPHPTPT